MEKKRYHLILDLTGVAPERIEDRDGLQRFLEEFPALIGMHILAGPFIHEGVPENPGLSGIVIIDYSHISVHTFSVFNEAMVDIFSCKPFEQDEAVKSVVDYFQVSSSNVRLKEVYWG